MKQRRTNKNCHLGLVTKFNGAQALCLINMGCGEVSINLPADVLKAHGLKETDRFKYWPAENIGQTKAADIHSPEDFRKRLFEIAGMVSVKIKPAAIKARMDLFTKQWNTPGEFIVCTHSMRDIETDMLNPKIRAEINAAIKKSTEAGLRLGK